MQFNFKKIDEEIVKKMIGKNSVSFDRIITLVLLIICILIAAFS